MAERPDTVDDGVTGLPAEFEALRWFHLPPVCLSDADRHRCRDTGNPGSERQRSSTAAVIDPLHLL